MKLENVTSFLVVLEGKVGRTCRLTVRRYSADIVKKRWEAKAESESALRLCYLVLRLTSSQSDGGLVT